MAKFKIADVIFEINTIYEYTKKLCEKYAYLGNDCAECVITITKADILVEKSKDQNSSPDFYLESLALLRKVNEFILKYKNGFMCHSSAIAVDGKAYLFTAKSGTGKSTHARLYREAFGDRVVMINDDKPIVREVDGEFYVYGSPWNGKHNLDNNVKFPIKAICEIRRGKQNVIKAIDGFEMLMVLFNQTVRPDEQTQSDLYLSTLDRLLKKVKLYRLECNMDISAAITSFNEMSK